MTLVLHYVTHETVTWSYWSSQRHVTTRAAIDQALAAHRDDRRPAGNLSALDEQSLKSMATEIDKQAQARFDARLEKLHDRAEQFGENFQ